jgi:phosphoribosylamine--glycine ligase
MRLLVIDPSGNGLDIAVRAKEAGHDVKLFMRKTDKTDNIGKRWIDVVDEFKPWLRWSQLVFNTDNTYYLRNLDSFKAEGGKLISATQESSTWELDRQIGMKMFQKAGIKVPSYRVFTDYDLAIAYVKASGARCVSKPSGDADKALSYCSKSAADMVFMLERWQKLGKLKAPFILQEFIAGTEMAVGAWIGPKGFTKGWCENFEFKKLMNGDLGVATGEQGTVLRVMDRSKLAQKVLKPLEAALLKTGHVGYVDVNCIIDDKGHPWPLEFTMRPGWPTFNIQQELVTGDPVQWLLDLANGVDSQQWKKNLLAIGVVVSIPDYPYSHLTKKEVTGIPIYGLSPEVWKHTHPCEMMWPKDSLPMQLRTGEIINTLLPVTAGDYVLVMSATGETVAQARSSVYRRLERLTMPNSPMYRTDIGQRLREQLPRLQAAGYSTGLTYRND